MPRWNYGWNYGDTIDGIYVIEREDKPGHYRWEPRPATIVGFSVPIECIRRNTGWLGDVLVRFADGTQSWQTLTPRR